MTDVANRNALGHFGKGNRLNPGGRHKAQRELCLLAREHVPAAFELAVALMSNEDEDSRVRLDAAKLICSYGLGAPPKFEDKGDGSDDDVVPSADQAAAAADELRKLDS